MSEPTRRIITRADGLAEIALPRFSAVVLTGPSAGTRATSSDGRLTLGSSEDAALRLADPTVSRFHAELEATEEGITVRDLDSTNGTRLGKARVREVVVRESVELEFGKTKVLLEIGAEPGEDRPALSDKSEFFGLLGASPAMRAIYGILERAAPTTAPVLVTGESGTGKELAARAVHAASPRAGEPFEVVDCGGLPPTLIESELFGHVRGAFTGANDDHEGAFERAGGGTLFLDELGELPLELQPKLLRALGEREIRRVGAKKTQPVDVRVVAATNRDLRREVNAGRFRGDLYYRLAVIQVRMPSLRDRLDDLPILARGLLQAIGRDRGVDVAGTDLEARLWEHSWPGNVRELRNYLEQLVILKSPPSLDTTLSEGDGALAGDLDRGLEQLPLTAAKNELCARFERQYVARLLERTRGNAAEAARIGGVSRATLFRMIRRYGLREASD
jgi:DNA-binding NtrC family response regulator